MSDGYADDQCLTKLDDTLVMYIIAIHHYCYVLLAIIIMNHWKITVLCRDTSKK